MPTPVSATRISADGRAAPGRRAALTAMLPPSGVNLIALMMRFSSTAETFSRSAMMAGSSGSSSARNESRFFSSSDRSDMWIRSTSGPRTNGWMLSEILPTSMREKSSSALMDLESRSRLRCTTTSPFSCFSLIGPSFRSRM